ncbi:conjugative transposon protein TraN [uncultured Flavobacterium sp.]|uniref:conjugative transposon protein TraN n=1 Tax=uncultured Flavobacterium sp. TaxID=165435 RepID=UPI0025E34C96|nr:conjugative transposon protein TraN [uncultured Flavobacterium sp.]
MKNIKTSLLAFLCALPFISSAQVAGPAAITKDIEISYSKTTTLVFPHPVLSVDRGSADILAQKAKGVENVLQLKAAQQDFVETNLTVITKGGMLYCFPLCYNEHPQLLTLSFTAKDHPGKIVLDDGLVNSEEVQRNAALARDDRSKSKIYREEAYGISLELTGRYIHDDIIYYRVRLSNASPIGYDIGQLRFFVRDQKRSKRTASQEMEILPAAVLPDAQKIAAHSKLTVVYALPKFTIPDKKNLIIELVEKGGGRHLQLKLKNRKAAKVTPLPSFK